MAAPAELCSSALYERGERILLQAAGGLARGLLELTLQPRRALRWASSAAATRDGRPRDGPSTCRHHGRGRRTTPPPALQVHLARARPSRRVLVERGSTRGRRCSLAVAQLAGGHPPSDLDLREHRPPSPLALERQRRTRARHRISGGNEPAGLPRSRDRRSPAAAGREGVAQRRILELHVQVAGGSTRLARAEVPYPPPRGASPRGRPPVLRLEMALERVPPFGIEQSGPECARVRCSYSASARRVARGTGQSSCRPWFADANREVREVVAEKPPAARMAGGRS